MKREVEARGVTTMKAHRKRSRKAASKQLSPVTPQDCPVDHAVVPDIMELLLYISSRLQIWSSIFKLEKRPRGRSGRRPPKGT